MCVWLCCLRERIQKRDRKRSKINVNKCAFANNLFNSLVISNLKPTADKYATFIIFTFNFGKHRVHDSRLCDR